MRNQPQRIFLWHDFAGAVCFNDIQKRRELPGQDGVEFRIESESRRERRFGKLNNLDQGGNHLCEGAF